MTQRRDTSPRYGGPVRLDRLARDCLGKVVTRQGFGSAEILTAWADIVGPEVAARSRPERIRWPRRRKDQEAGAATLVVRAEGGDALEIQHMKDDILARLNAFLGWAAVGKLVVRQAPMPEADGPAQARRERPPAGAGGSAALAAIDDPGLREALSRLAAARAGEPDNSA